MIELNIEYQNYAFGFNKYNRRASRDNSKAPLNILKDERLNAFCTSLKNINFSKTLINKRIIMPFIIALFLISFLRQLENLSKDH